MTAAEARYFRASRAAHRAWAESQPQYVIPGVLEEGVDRAGGGSAAAPSSSASSDGNPLGHPPDDQRFPASSLSAWGRDNGALDLSAEEVPHVACCPTTEGLVSPTSESSASAESPTVNGPGRNTPKVSRGQGQEGA